MKYKVALEAELTADYIQLQHDYFKLIHEGRPLQPDPFYARNDKLTPEMVTKVLDDLEGVYQYEIEHYPTYHIREQGLAANEHLQTPGFNKLPYAQKLAIVQGFDKLFQKYRDDTPVEVKQETNPEVMAIDYNEYY